MRINLIARLTLRMLVRACSGRHAVSAVVLLTGTATHGYCESLAYITNQRDNSVSVLDLVSAKVIKTIPVCQEPAGVSVSADQQWVLISCPGDGKVALLESRNHSLVESITTGKSPLALVAGIDKFYVADWHSDVVTVHNLPGGQLIKTIPVGRSPSGLVHSSKLQSLFVSNRDDNSISRIDTNSLNIVATIPTGPRPFGMRFDNSRDRLYVANVAGNSISVIDTKTNHHLTDVPVGDRPYDLALFREGNGIAVTNQYDDTISIIDAQSLQVLATLEVGEYPEGINTHPDDRHVLVVNWFSNTVQMVDPARGLISNEMDVGDGPRGYGNFVLRW